jgi:hypothetical protein
VEPPPIYESEQFRSRWATTTPNSEEQNEPQQRQMKEGQSRSSLLHHRHKIIKAYVGSCKKLILSENSNRLKGAITHISAANVK